MRSFVPHFVVTTSDCLAIGGHFYSSVAYYDTLKSLIAEHFVGKNTTNASHTMSPLILCQAMVSLAAAVTGDEAMDPKKKRVLIGDQLKDCKSLSILRYEYKTKVIFHRETAIII